MIQVIETRSGSIYELDEDASRIRRVSGTGPEKIAPDGEWRTYEAHHDLREGWRFLVSFGPDDQMLTSVVTKVTAQKGFS